ncbi:HNH endonuclease signature motif containing protein [Sphingomonas sp. IC081]|uniref:HNH endonuclease signature motif containing protein n=1 Tax=Sphingomonas sp. IC081 TaxID=304378 RepID=UPI0011592009|nr:HNH endonuclease signature motif containing protein [Sphingomonas sp. IC081]QDK32697.1 hypothetical protein DM450_07850 [Sphingomonas sp. IC081]
MNKRNASGAKTALTKEILDAIYSYDSENGYFIRLNDSGKYRKGTIAGSVHKHIGYTEIRIGGVNYYAHRLANLTMTGEWPSAQMDHINGLRSDNRWANLRAASPSENTRNQPGWASSGHKCVTTYDTQAFGPRYRVKVVREGETFQQVFADLEQAITFRDSTIRYHDGAFANTSHRDDN